MTQGVAGEEFLYGGRLGTEGNQNPSRPTDPRTHGSGTPDEDHEEGQAAHYKQDICGDTVYWPSSLGVTTTVD